MKKRIIQLTNKGDIETVRTRLDPDSIMSDGYGIICKTVMTDRKLSIQAKAIYSYLVSFAGTDGSCYPTVKRIREDLKIKSSDTYYKHLQQLVDNGYIVIYQTRIDNMKSNNIYEIILSKTKIERLKEELIKYNENKKVASTEHTNNFDESLNNDSKITNDMKSISHDISENQVQIEQKSQENIVLLEKNKIHYSKKDIKQIESMDKDILKKAIKITKEKADKPNFKYLLSTYDSLSIKKESTQSEDKKTKFHNFDETFNEYSVDELNEIIDKSQKEKFKMNDNYNNKDIELNLYQKAIDILQSKTVLTVNPKDKYWADEIDKKVQELKCI